MPGQQMPAQQMPGHVMPVQPQVVPLFPATLLLVPAQAAAPVPFFNPAQYQNGNGTAAPGGQQKAVGGWESGGQQDQNQNTVQE
jgi:hypothetical protein